MRVVTVLLALVCSADAVADQSAAPAGAALYIVQPAAGARLKSPVTVVFGLTGMGIAPAGVTFDNTGHHHIDSELPPDLTLPLPVSINIRHFGNRQTQATLDLSPGKHTLQLLFADFTHTPFTPTVASKKFTITVSR